MARTSPEHGRAYWERILAREGLAPLDKDGEMLPSHESEQKPSRSSEASDWLIWAQEIAGTCEFRDRKDREVWRLISRGLSRRQVAKRMRMTVPGVARIIERVEMWSPLPPPPNPWRRGGTPRKEREDEDTDLVSTVARDPAAAADMLKQATLYIEDLGDEYMNEFKERIGATDFDTDDYQQYGIAGEFAAPDTNVWLPSDGVPMSELSGPARTLTPEEIAKLDYTPPRKN